jgi:aldose 1-epimerase
MREGAAASHVTEDGRVKITAGRAELEVAPAAGGCITAFRWRGDDGVIDWLRPAPARGDVAPTDSACFPLVPYSNRIRDGRFSFQGRDYRLGKNFPPSPHSIHGHGWQAPWQVTEIAGNRLTLVFNHAVADWPATYRAEQRCGLVDGALHVDLAVVTTGDRAKPPGLGLHP